MQYTATFLLREFNKFRRGHTSVFDMPQRDIGKTVAMVYDMTQVHDIILADRRLQVDAISEILGMLGVAFLWFIPDNKRNLWTTSQ